MEQVMKKVHIVQIETAPYVTSPMNINLNLIENIKLINCRIFSNNDEEDGDK